MLPLRRGVVLAAGDPGGPMQELEVRLGGDRRQAVADVALVGAAQIGDEVIVNVAAADLELGTGGFDIVHANLTRGLDAPITPPADLVRALAPAELRRGREPAAPADLRRGREPAAPADLLRGLEAAGGHAVKLSHTSLHHAVVPVEAGVAAGAPLVLPTDAPVAICLAHGQLAPLAWAFARAAPGARLGYIQTPGGALPGALSESVRLLRRRGLLAAHLTAGEAYGGEGDAVTTAGALQHGFAERYWHAAVCAPGPGAIASGTALGHGGMVALASAHAAAALGCQVVICPPHGISQPTRMLLELALVPFIVAHHGERPRAGRGRHEWRQGVADLDAYAASGLPSRAFGRSIEEDPDVFAAALAAGSVLAQCAA